MVAILLFLAFLIAVNALYVAAEFATVAVKKFKIEALAEQGDLAARRLLPHVSDSRALDRYVAACQIGITASSLVLGAVGQSHLAAFLRPLLHSSTGLDPESAGSLAATAVLLGLTALQVVLGELVPKAIALRFPEQLALALTLPMSWSLSLFTWFIALLNGSGNLVLHLLRVPAHAHRHVHSPEELEQLLAHGASGGTLEVEEHRRLKQALRFGHRPVRSAMVPRIRMVTLDLKQGLEGALEIMEGHPYSRVPAWRESEDAIVGVLHLKDLALALARKPVDLESLLRPPLLLPGSTPVQDALETLRRERQRMALLLDEYGGTLGLVTLEDLVEEVLGEIDGEYDRARPDLVPVGGGEYLARGVLPLATLEETLGRRLPHKDVQTVGGLVMHLVGDIPTAGQRVRTVGVELVVEEMRGRQVSRVRIRPLPGGEAP